MPGLRRLDGDLGRLQVANLADHDHVRVLAQEGAQRLGEVHALARIDVDLVDAFQVDLHRVFGSGDVDVGGVEDVQAGVQGDRLARAGGPGDQDHALRLLERSQVEFLLVPLVAQGVDAHLRARGVEDPHHDLLAPQGRQGVDADGWPTGSAAWLLHGACHRYGNVRGKSFHRARNAGRRSRL